MSSDWWGSLVHAGESVVKIGGEAVDETTHVIGSVVHGGAGVVNTVVVKPIKVIGGTIIDVGKGVVDTGKNIVNTGVGLVGRGLTDLEGAFNGITGGLSGLLKSPLLIIGVIGIGIVLSRRQ